MTDRVLTPLIALGLACLVWMYLRSRDQVQVDLEVPVAVEVTPALAGQYELDPATVAGLIVRVEFAGPPSRVREVKGQVQRNELRLRRVVTVPDHARDDLRCEVTLRLDAADLGLPAGVAAVVHRQAREPRVALRKLGEKVLAVRPRLTGGDRPEEVAAEPATVTVRGPLEALRSATHIDTEPVAAPPAPPPAADGRPPPPVRVPARLATALGAVPVQAAPAEVTLRVTPRPPQAIFSLEDVPVTALLPLNFPYAPRSGTGNDLVIRQLRVRGPAAAARPTARAYIDLTAPGRQFAAKLYPEEPITVLLPPGYELAQEPPRLSALILVPVEGGGGLPP